VTIQQARADMKRVTGDLTAAYPDADTGIGATLMPLKEQMVGYLRPLICSFCSRRLASCFDRFA